MGVRGRALVVGPLPRPPPPSLPPLLKVSNPPQRRAEVRTPEKNLSESAAASVRRAEVRIPEKNSSLEKKLSNPGKKFVEPRKKNC